MGYLWKVEDGTVIWQILILGGELVPRRGWKTVGDGLLLQSLRPNELQRKNLILSSMGVEEYMEGTLKSFLILN